jgi:hypothetical protein
MLSLCNFYIQTISKVWENKTSLSIAQKDDTINLIAFLVNHVILVNDVLLETRYGPIHEPLHPGLFPIKELNVLEVGVHTAEELNAHELRKLLHQPVDIVRLVHILELDNSLHYFIKPFVDVLVVRLPRIVNREFLVQSRLLVVALLNNGSNGALEEGEGNDTDDHEKNAEYSLRLVFRGDISISYGHGRCDSVVESYYI